MRLARHSGRHVVAFGCAGDLASTQHSALAPLLLDRTLAVSKHDWCYFNIRLPLRIGQATRCSTMLSTFPWFNHRCRCQEGEHQPALKRDNALERHRLQAEESLIRQVLSAMLWVTPCCGGGPLRSDLQLVPVPDPPLAEARHRRKTTHRRPARPSSRSRCGADALARPSAALFGPGLWLFVWPPSARVRDLRIGLDLLDRHHAIVGLHCATCETRARARDASRRAALSQRGLVKLCARLNSCSCSCA